MSETLVKERCNECQNSTNHEVLSIHKNDWGEDFSDDWGEIYDTTYFQQHYAILQCAGCGEIQFSYSSHSSEYPEDGWISISYPPRIARKKPEWMNDPFSAVPRDISITLEEIYVALQNNLPTLATIGTRTVLDMVMTNKIGDAGNFKEKIDRFAEKGHIASNLVDTLTNALDAGNASAHRGYRADESTIGKIFDIVEGVIHTVYILPSHSEPIKSKTPPKKSGKTK